MAKIGYATPGKGVLPLFIILDIRPKWVTFSAAKITLHMSFFFRKESLHKGSKI